MDKSFHFNEGIKNGGQKKRLDIPIVKYCLLLSHPPSLHAYLFSPDVDCQTG